jgi:hypothetical protein
MHFFVSLYCCFTALLFSQNPTNSVYVATNTSVFGIENSFIKKIEKKQITLYLKENTGYYGLNALKNTRLLFFTSNTLSYKISTIANTSQLQTHRSFSKTPQRFSSSHKNPYSIIFGYNNRLFISLTRSHRRNPKRKKAFTVSKCKAAISVLETALQNTKKQYYPTKTIVSTSICWLVNTYANPPPQRS